MARIAGVDIPNNKRVEIALTYIYGIGRKSANDILAATGVNPDTRAKDLTELSITSRSLAISSSVRSFALVSGLTPVAARISLALLRPIP